MREFPKDSEVIFYFPSLPGSYRDNLVIKVLVHFTKSIILIEKPTNITAQEALSFEQKLKQKDLYDRVIFGQHDALDPSRAKILQLAKENKNQIKEIKIKFNYPKS